MGYCLRMFDVYVELSSHDIFRGVNSEAQSRKVLSIAGKNETGKTTLLRVASGILKPLKGLVLVFGCNLSQHKNLNAFPGVQNILTQQDIFEYNSVQVIESFL